MTEIELEQEQIKSVVPGKAPVGDLGNALDYERAIEIYEASVPRIGWKLGQDPEAYATQIANASREGNPRVRSYLKQMARRDWLAFETGAVDPRMAMVDIIDHVDIRRGGNVGWITSTKYLISRKTVVIRNKPRHIDDALSALQEAGYTVRSYGSTWYRAWPGSPTPVRNRDEIALARQEMANGTFYIPEDYHVAEGQINLAFDL
jgi:hypothetical protein